MLTKSKSLILTLGFVLISLAGLKAQSLNVGLKAGVAQSQLRGLKDTANYKPGSSVFGYHAGAFAKLGLGGIFLQPELLYTNTGGKIDLPDDTKTIRFHQLDLPVLVGKQFLGIAKVYLGPVASLNINQAGDVQNIDKGSLNDATFGYQAGIGLEISKITIDLKYEGNLSALGKNVEIGDEGYSTDMRASQYWLDIGFKIF